MTRDEAPKLWYYPYELRDESNPIIELLFFNTGFINPPLNFDEGSIILRVVKVRYEKVYFKNSPYEYLYVKYDEKKKFLEDFCGIKS